MGVCAPIDVQRSTHPLTPSLRERGKWWVAAPKSHAVHGVGGRATMLMLRALILACLPILSSCGSTPARDSRSAATADTRPMPPEPRPGPRTPVGAQSDALVIQVAAKPRDTNGNKFPDLIEVMANLFATPHPMPLHENGAFVFQLYLGGGIDNPQAAALREWRIDGADLEGAKVINPLFGATYQFRLSLLENGTDRLPLMAVDLVAWFEPADGREPIVRREVHTMQIGAREAGE